MGKKYKISKKGRKIRQEVGNRNLQKWKAENPKAAARAHRTHGLSSEGISTTRKIYKDGRTNEGKALRAIIKGIVEDLGGADRLNSAQQLLLAGIETKLIVVLQIAKYVNRQPELLSKEGQLLPVLERNYLNYQAALEKSLEALYKSMKPGAKVPTLEEIIAVKGQK